MCKINLDQETIDRLLDLYNDKRRKFDRGVELLDSDNDKIAARGSDYMSEGCGALTAIDSLLDILGYQIIVDDEDCAYDIRYIIVDDEDCAYNIRYIGDDDLDDRCSFPTDRDGG